MQQPADPEKVEQIVGELVEAIQRHGEFSANDGLSAAFTFAQRFAKSVITLSESSTAKEVNVSHIASTLRRMAAEIELLGMPVSNKVH